MIRKLGSSGTARAEMPGAAGRIAIAALLFAGTAPDVSRVGEPAPQHESLEPAPAPLVQHVARRYRIGEAAAGRVVNAAYLSADEVGVDPLLVLAVIAVESSFNPAAESGAGAKGLMQIVPAWHRARLDEYGGEEQLLDPLTNIAVGTRILNDYIARSADLEAALQSYNGAARDPSARYARKVLAELDLLRQR